MSISRHGYLADLGVIATETLLYFHQLVVPFRDRSRTYLFLQRDDDGPVSYLARAAKDTLTMRDRIDQACEGTNHCSWRFRLRF